MLEIVDHVGDPDQPWAISVAKGHTLYVVKEGVRAVGWFDNREDAELFVRAKEIADPANWSMSSCVPSVGPKPMTVEDLEEISKRASEAYRTLLDQKVKPDVILGE